MKDQIGMLKSTKYERNFCKVGLVHLGCGAFHRAHQAVYIDDYMGKTGDLSWGIAGINLRSSEARIFDLLSKDKGGYLLKTTSPDGISHFRMVRSHVHFSDWSKEPRKAEELLGLPSVKALSMTVTESGYYLNDDWSLDLNDPLVASEIKGNAKRSVYAFLSASLKYRMEKINLPITILCCDNIRSNGEILERNFRTYLKNTKQFDLENWLNVNVTFPNSMVDRITPRATSTLKHEVSQFSADLKETAIHGEHFIQWVIENKFANDMPALDEVGVELVDQVNPYEEAKIRILNGGHTALCYLGALAKLNTFDQVMADKTLRSHFDNFEKENVLPGLTLDLPFSKYDYCDLIAKRFSNSAIADDLGRICMDGWSKFPIFLRPTIKSCLRQKINPKWCYDSIASWYIYARRFARGQTHIPYVEPYWDQLEPLLKEGQEDNFSKLEALWSDLPRKYKDFAPEIVSAIKRVEEKWPI